MSNKPKQNQGKVKILWVVSSILAILIAGAFVTWWTIYRADKLMREDFLQTTRLVAQAIGNDGVKKLSGTEADLASFEYLQLKEQLIAAQTAYPKCLSLYLMGRRNDGKVFIYMDSKPAGSKDESPASHIYEEISPEYLIAFERKTECTIGPVTDHHGTWVTSLIPIKNNTTGELIAFLGMDIDGKDWKREAAHEGFVPVSVTIILVVIVLAVSAMMAWRARHITRSIRALNYIEASMAAAIGVTVTLFSIWIANNYEIKSDKEIFYHILNTKTIGVTSVLETLQDVELEGLSTVFSLRERVTDESFRDFTKYLEKNSAIQGLAWVPVVSDEHKKALEQYGRKELSSDYEIWELDSSGNRIPAKGRPYYYPIYFESFVGSELGLGFDLGSERIKAQTLEVARRTGHTLCTDPITLADKSGQQDEILVFRPVFEKDKPELMLGFATARVRMGTLLKTAAASGFDNTPLSMELYMLQKSGPAIRLSSVTIGEDDSEKNESFSITRPIFIFGRTFAVVARPGAEVEALHTARYGWVTGLAGLVITIAIVLVIGFIAHRKEKLELLVHERTRALHESEGLQRLLMERISAGVMIIDAQTQVIEAINPFAARLIGAQEEQILGHTCHPFICPMPDGSCTAIDMGHEVNNLDTTIIRSDGNHSPILKSIKRIRIHGKEKLLETFVDITELKRAEESLRESRQILQTVLDTSPVRIFWKDRNSVFRGCNKQFAFDSGFNDPSELIGKSDYEMGWREQAEIYRADDRQVMESGVQKLLIEEPQTTPDGRTIWLLANKTPLRDASGNVSGVLGVYMDITEYREAVEALRDSEEKFRALVENNNDAIMRFDREHRHLYVNPIVQEETGIPQSEFFNKTHEELGFPEHLCSLFKDALDKVFHSGKVNRVEFQLPKGIWVDWMLIPEMDEYGQVKAVITTSRDITERKREEEEREKLLTQLAQAQKMESVGRLAGGVAHDFNNMLSVIIGYSELAIRETAANDPLHIQLQEILKAAKRSADLTRQLLAFARKQTVSPKLIDLNEIVGNIIKLLVRLIGENIHLTWLPDTGKLPVNIDPSQIDQILTNLCVNARDAISGVGNVIIETHSVIFDKYYCSTHPEVIPGEYVMLCVSDNGCGMDKETLDNIFEPFFTTKESGKGTGLGLATVYGIVKQNDGFINAYSEPGQGTTFKIYLPRCDTKPVSIQKESPVGYGTLGHETILLVEDEPAILDIGRLMLERLGYQVLTAPTPGEAIHLAKEYDGEINLLITDVVMPEMNGRDLAKNLLSFYPGIKRLFMSGYTGDVIAYHGMLDKGVHFIQKPFTIEDLSAKVREAIDSK